MGTVASAHPVPTTSDATDSFRARSAPTTCATSSSSGEERWHQRYQLVTEEKLLSRRSPVRSECRKTGCHSDMACGNVEQELAILSALLTPGGGLTPARERADRLLQQAHS